MTNIPEKYYVEIHAPGKFNDAIIAMITNHNGGSGVLPGFDTIRHYIKACTCQYPTITPETKMVETLSGNGPASSIRIHEGPEHTPTLTISYNTFKK